MRLPCADARAPQELEDCCQLVKANSIQGNKDSSAVVVYTPWANLRKSSECAFALARCAVSSFLGL